MTGGIADGLGNRSKRPMVDGLRDGPATLVGGL